MISAVHSVFPDQSIQAAVDEAANGDTIVIHDGLYRETTILYGKRLTIGSLFLLDGDSTHVAATVVSPDSIRPDTMSCFVYAYGEENGGRLVGLTLSEGRGTFWPLADGLAGGAIYIASAALQIERCNVQGNEAGNGGGIAATFVEDIIETNVTIIDCEFRNCRCDDWGGAVYAAYCSLRVTNCVFDSNTCGAMGAGAWVMHSVATVDSCLFTHGLGWYSGGLDLWDSRVGNVTNCEFRFNRVFDGADGGTCDLGFIRNGGAVTCCVFSHNLSPLHSVSLEGNSQRPVRFIGNVVESNHTGVSTGTIAISNSEFGEVAFNVLRDNLNNQGGAVFCYSGTDIRIHHNVFSQNSSINPLRGSAIHAGTSSAPQIDSNIIDGNFGAAVSRFSSQNPILDARNNWWGDPSGPYHPTANPGGLGDTLLADSILFIPWLTVPPDTTLLGTTTRPRSLPLATWQLISLYPNPFNSELTLEIAGFTPADFRVTLHNLLGQEVARLFDGQVNGGRVTLTIPHDLSTGIYFVRLRDVRVSEIRKVVYLK